jgi:aspartate/glutamate racemase
MQLTDSADRVADSVVDSDASVVLVGDTALALLVDDDDDTLEVVDALALEEASADSASSSSRGSPVHP